MISQVYVINFDTIFECVQKKKEFQAHVYSAACKWPPRGNFYLDFIINRKIECNCG